MKNEHKKELLNLADEIAYFEFKAPFDDGDYQTAEIYGFKGLVKNFLHKAKKIDDPRLQNDLNSIDSDIETIYEMYDLHADLIPLIDDLREIIKNSGESDNQNVDLKQKLIALGEEIANFYWKADNFYEDDPYIMELEAIEFFDLARRFILFANRIDDTELKSLLEEIEIDLSNSHQKLAQTKIGIALEIIQEKEQLKIKTESKNTQKKFISEETLAHLRKIENSDFDLSKVIKICQEINDAYLLKNWISLSLLIKTLINHIPPIFGHTTFKQVVSNASRSTKKHFENLENFVRPTADKHTHELIRHKEILPTGTQVEPFSGSVEILLQEIIVILNHNE